MLFPCIPKQPSDGWHGMRGEAEQTSEILGSKALMYPCFWYNSSTKPCCYSSLQNLWLLSLEFQLSVYKLAWTLQVLKLIKFKQLPNLAPKATLVWVTPGDTHLILPMLQVSINGLCKAICNNIYLCEVTCLIDTDWKVICDPFCQNETLLCTWSKLSYWYTTKVYILPFILTVKILKSDNTKGSYAHLTIGVLKSMKWRYRLSNFCGLSLGQWPIGPQIIKITPHRLQILI